MPIQGRTRRLNKDSLPEWAGRGVIYLTSDTNEFYIGQGPGLPLKKVDNETQHVKTFADLPANGDSQTIYIVQNDENDYNRVSTYIYIKEEQRYQKIDDYHDAIQVNGQEIDGVITLIAGNHMSITPDPVNKTITFDVNMESVEDHTHTNLEDLERLSIDENNRLLVDGNPIVVKDEEEPPTPLMSIKVEDQILTAEQIELLAGLGIDISVNASKNQIRIDSLSGGSGGTGSIDLYQITKMNVEATPQNPKIINIAIPRTTDFRRLPVEILKFIPVGENIIRTEVSFDNNDADDFESNDWVIFDGKMKLKTTITSTPIEEVLTEEHKIMKFEFDLTHIQSIQSIEVK